MPLSGRLIAAAQFDYTSALDLATGLVPLNLTTSIALANGIGANQADKIFHDTRPIAASATDTLDLAGGLLDAFNVALTFVKLKAVYLRAASGNTNNVVFTRPATNGVPIFSAAGDALPVRPGGVFLWTAPDATGVPVTPATGDLIDIVNSAGGSTVTYDIVIVGTSA